MKETYLTIADVAKILKVSYDTALTFVKHNVEYISIGSYNKVKYIGLVASMALKVR